MDKIAVLIPCYNESETVAKVVADFRRALPEAVIYVYDNNSTDGTDDIARGADRLAQDAAARLDGAPHGIADNADVIEAMINKDEEKIPAGTIKAVLNILQSVELGDMKEINWFYFDPDFDISAYVPGAELTMPERTIHYLDYSSDWTEESADYVATHIEDILAERKVEIKRTFPFTEAGKIQLIRKTGRHSPIARADCYTVDFVDVEVPPINAACVGVFRKIRENVLHTTILDAQNTVFPVFLSNGLCRCPVLHNFPPYRFICL